MSGEAVDVLINNAGIAYRSVSMSNMSPQRDRFTNCRRIFSEPMELTRLVLPRMRDKRAGAADTQYLFGLVA